MNKKNVFALLILFAVLFGVVGCGSGTDTAQQAQDKAAETSVGAEDGITDERTLEEKTENKEYIEIVMEDGSAMDFELYPDVAPITVENFLSLVNEGFYDGLTFHRIIEDFMIQGGAAKDGTSVPAIKGEFSDNGIINDLSHVRGVISMARAQGYNTASSQFFIMHKDTPYLDGKYAAFGMMTSGFEVLDKLAMTPVTDSNGTVAPENQPVIKTIRVK